MKNIEAIKNDLLQFSNPERVKIIARYLRAYPGGYGEGDCFIGVTAPNQRKTAKMYYKTCPLKEVEELLCESVHEFRLTALFILVLKFEKSKTEAEKKDIVDIYLRNAAFVNNWDLVDSSADKILGPYLFNKDRNLLYEFASSKDLWKQRIAIITTHYFIKNGQFDDTLKIARILLSHNHDLIHKAVGWMLREVGNRDFDVEFDFLKKYYKVMPRTMLRYAIEKFDVDLRDKFLKGFIC